MRFTFLQYRVFPERTNLVEAHCLSCHCAVPHHEGIFARRRISKGPGRHGFLCLACLYQYIDESPNYFGEGLPFEGVKERRVDVGVLYTKDQVKEFLMSKTPENA